MCRTNFEENKTESDEHIPQQSQNLLFSEFSEMVDRATPTLTNKPLIILPEMAFGAFDRVWGDKPQ